MKALQVLASLVYSAGCCIVFFFFLFYYRFGFNYETALNDHYYLVFVFPFLLLLVLVYVFTKEDHSFSLRFFLWMLLTVILCGFLLFSKYYSFGNEYFVVTVAVFFIGSGFLLVKNRFGGYTIIGCLLAMNVFQLYTGFLQWSEASVFEGNNSALLVNGTLENSGVYACYLVIHLPLWSWIARLAVSNKNSFYRIVLIILLMLVVAMSVVLIIKTQSRTAYIALAVVILGTSLQQYGSRLRRFLLELPTLVMIVGAIVIAAVSTATGYYLFAMKKMSAVGRMMKVQVAWEHITDHFWTGTGIGRFTWYYPQWQEQYFKHTTRPPHEYFLSAGESYILFNEYLQWFETAGLIGTFITVCFLVYFFTSTSERHKHFFDALKLTVITVMVCGISSYPLHVNAILLLLMFCFAVVVGLRENRSSLFSRKFVIKRQLLVVSFWGIVVTAMCGTGWKGFEGYQAVKQWGKMKKTFTPQENIGKKYDILHSNLVDNGKFLISYSHWLVEDSTNYHKAIKIAEEAKEYIFTREGMETAANAYSKLNDYTNVIRYWERVGNYLPNKFGPKYELLKAYQAAGDTVNAKRIAMRIIVMPVKINSLEVKGIKEAATKLLTQGR